MKQGSLRTLARGQVFFARSNDAILATRQLGWVGRFERGRESEPPEAPRTFNKKEKRLWVTPFEARVARLSRPRSNGLAEEDAARLALGQRAKLVLNVGAAPREFNGVVSAFRLDEVNSVAATVRHSFRVVPRLFFCGTTSEHGSFKTSASSTSWPRCSQRPRPSVYTTAPAFEQNGRARYGFFNDPDLGRALRDKIREKLAEGAEFHVYACKTGAPGAFGFLPMFLKVMADTFKVRVFAFKVSVWYFPKPLGSSFDRLWTGVGTDQADAEEHMARGIFQSDARTSFITIVEPRNPTP